MAPRILILLHETDPYPDGPSYFAWGLRDAWREMGIEVRIARGLKELEPADLVLPHVDLTVTPPEYREALDAVPNAVNAGVYDISKRRVSGQLVGPEDPWDGPVIVKTDRNHGGLPERRMKRAQRTLRSRIRYHLRIGAREKLPAPLVHGSDYMVFDRIAEVPDAAFEDPRLVVERFLPEREGDMYYLRWYLFLGDRYRSMRVGARNPLVKLAGRVSKERSLPVPEEIRAVREAWGLDFGKIDYVMYEGSPVVLDISRTPSDMPPPQRLTECRPYARGVLPLLARAAGAGVEFDHCDVDRPPARELCPEFSTGRPAQRLIESRASCRFPKIALAGVRNNTVGTFQNGHQQRQ